MSADFDAEIAQRIKAKGKPETPAQKQSRIEEIASRLAELKGQYNALDGASSTARRLPKNKLKYCADSHIKSAMDAASHEQYMLEQALSVAKPESLRDVLITIAVSLWRLDVIKGTAAEEKEDFETDRGIVENTLERAIPVLEKHAGVTCAELGLDSYFTPSKSPEELVADVAALKAANNLGKLSAFTGAEPVSNAEEYEFLKERLRRIMIAWKTMNDLDAHSDDNPLHVALLEAAGKAEQEIVDLPMKSLAVGAAKLVVAGMAEARTDLNDPDNYRGGWTTNLLAAETVLKAIEWFGLKELYDAYIPEDFGRDEAAS